MGDIDVSALAEACTSGSIQGQLSLLTYTDPVWGPTNVGEEQIDSGTANQIAGLLGLNAQNLPMTTTYKLAVGSTDISNAWYINVDGYWENLADLANECMNGPQGDECQMGALLASMVPGSTINSACAATPPTGDIQSFATVQTPGGPESVVAPYTPTYSSTPTSSSATTTATAANPVPVTSTPATSIATGSTVVSAPASSTAATTPAPVGGASTGTASSTAASSSSASTPSWETFLDQSAWDGIPNWALLAGGALGLVLLMGMMGGRR